MWVDSAEDGVDVSLVDVEEMVVPLRGKLDEEVVDVIRLETDVDVLVDELVIEVLIVLEVGCVWEMVVEDVDRLEDVVYVIDELMDVVAILVVLEVELLSCVFVVELKLVVVDDTVDVADEVEVVDELCVLLVVVVEVLVDVEEVVAVEIIETVPSLKFVTYTSPF